MPQDGGIHLPEPAAARSADSHAQRSVETLCSRFSALFAQLHKEEAAMRAANERNALLETRLRELRGQLAADGPPGSGIPALEEERFAKEALHLGREAEAAELSAALVEDEALAIADAAAAYARQVARLQEHLREEASGERASADLLRQLGGELHELRGQRADLGTALEAAESERVKVTDELASISKDGHRVRQEVTVLEHLVQEERAKAESAEAEARRQRDELAALEEKLGRTSADLEELTRRLEAERSEGLDCEEALKKQVAQRDRAEEELRSLAAQLEALRRDGSERKTALDRCTHEVRRLRESLRHESQLEQQEQASAGKASERLSRARGALAEVERERAGAESELQRLKRSAAELEETCSAQRSWCQELRQKHTSSEVALERLRQELAALLADRSRLQREVDDAHREKSQLEVELQVATPQLQDIWSRSQNLEDRLVARVRELADQAESVRRCRREADSAKAQAEELERRTGAIWGRVRDVAGPEARLRDAAGPEAPDEARAHAPLPAAEAPFPAAVERRTPQRRSPSQRVSWEPSTRQAAALAAQVPPLPGDGHARPAGAIAWSTFGPRTWETPAAEAGDADAAVRFLVDFVAREEERLGLTSSAPRG